MTLLRKWLPVVIWAAIILSAANDRFSDEETAGWLERSLGVGLPRAVNFALRKSGHVLSYAILALLAWRAHHRLGVVLAVALTVAVTDETMQAMTLTRDGSAFDVLLDTSGALLGGALAQWWGARRRAGS